MKKLLSLAIITLAFHVLPASANQTSNLPSGGSGAGSTNCATQVPPPPECGSVSPTPPPCTDVAACIDTDISVDRDIEDSTGALPSPSPMPDGTVVHEFPPLILTLPPDANTGFSNESQGRGAIDDALDFFGTDGVLVQHGGGASKSSGTDGTGALTKNGKGGNSPGSAAVSFGANNKDLGNSKGNGAYATLNGNDSNLDDGVGKGTAGGDANKADLALTGSDRFGVNGTDQDSKFDGNGRSTGSSGAGGLSDTGEMGVDGPGGAGRLRNGKDGAADEYLVRTGKLSLFEIVNRRYEIWGSQNLR